MSNKMACILSFSVGAAVSAVVTWRILKNKYEQIANEEIASVKEVFSRRHSNKDEQEAKPEPNVEEAPNESDIQEYGKQLAKNNYAYYANTEKKQGVVPMDDGGPVVIAPEEFGVEDEYDTVSYTLYADGVLIDDTDNSLVERVEQTVGSDSLKAFGEYEDDAVHVRNDKLKRYYEILKDFRKYSDVKPRPYSPPDTEE